jgi:hypothetical protein
MTTRRDPDRLIHAFLMEGRTEAADSVYDAVRAVIEHKRQRAVIGPWRMPDMNKLVPLGLGAAAVVTALVVGAQLLGAPSPGGVGAGPSATASPTAEPSAATPSPDATPLSTTEAGLPEGPFVVTGTGDPVQVTLDIAAPGWLWMPEVDGLSKDDDSLDPPETVGAALIAWAWPAGTGFNVYGDPCQWSTTIPATPATTPDEIAAGLAAQASREATAPVDVTLGGYAGKAITLHVPTTFDKPNATREEEFAACDDDVFATYGLEADETVAERNAQGPGQIDEMWILDVDGSIVILDATYSPATPTELVDELRALAESATFE